MRKSWFYLFLVIQLFDIQLFCQQISYLIPDIGAPGLKNIYIEIIGPFDKTGNFGADGMSFNEIGDNIRLELVNPDDSNKVVFGPLIVSWNGRMISTQVFIYPWITPNSDDWAALDNRFKIPIRAVTNGIPGNVDTFYIVKPFTFGDKSKYYQRVLGEGGLGKRSRRGAMIVDYMVLADDKYTVSTSDCDPISDGNQGYLPFILLSKGKIEGGPSTEINVDAIGKKGGPGGGGGAGNYCDYGINSGSYGTDGGDGYTGGGPGGLNGVHIVSDRRKSPGKGSGAISVSSEIGGLSLNGVPGGNSTQGHESAGGGTGHPFGKSGDGCADGNNCSPQGGFGGGSGYQQKRAGGNAGYGTDGRGGVFNNGKAHGNSMVVPIAGGSGGASGNPEVALGGCSGEGGGGGGAISVFGLSVKNLILSSNGAIRQKSGDGDGGNGSGGYAGIYSKLGIENINLNVYGGFDSLAGTGRIRYDTPFINILNGTPSYGSIFRGITTDTTSYVRDSKNFTLSISQPIYTNGRLYIKPQSGNWKRSWTVLGNTNDYFTSPLLNLPGIDSIYCIVYLHEVSSPLTYQYLSEPEFVMSQAAANMIKVLRSPKISGDSLRILHLTNCSGSVVYDTAWITNTGDFPLILNFENSTFEMGYPGFELVSPKVKTTLQPTETVQIIIKFTYQQGQTGNITDALWVQHNDSTAIHKPWEIFYRVEIESLSLRTIDHSFRYYIDTLDLGKICLNDSKDSLIAVKNESSIDISLSNPIFSQNPNLQVSIPGNKKIKVNLATDIEVTYNGIKEGKFATYVYFKVDSCDDVLDSILVIGEVVHSGIQFITSSDFGDVRVGKVKAIQLVLKNNGSGATTISDIPGLQPPFRITKTVPIIPPPVTLKPGDSIIFTIEFAPQLDINYDTTYKILGLSLATTSCADSTEILITGKGSMTKVSLSADSIFFGTFPWCLSSKDTIVTIRNYGDASVTILEEPQIFPNDDNFKITSRPVNPIPITLQPNDSVKYSILFAPVMPPDGLNNAVFTIKTDDVKPIYEVKLSGFREPLNIVPSQNVVDFGNVPLGSTSSQSMTFTNVGIYDRNLSKTLNHTTELAINPQSKLINKDSGTFEFDITYKPVKSGDFIDTVSFVFDSPCNDTIFIIVKGKGVEAALNVSNIDFGFLYSCNQRKDSVKIENTGEAPLYIQNISIKGKDAQYFTQLTNFTFPDTLAPKSKIYVKIMFNPANSSDGVKHAQLSTIAIINASETEFLSDLVGEKQSGLASIPDSIDFGNVVVGSGKTVNLTLSNNGIFTIKINSLAPLNIPSVFSINPGTINTTLNKGQSTQFTVQFNPLAITSYLDTLKFSINVNNCDDTKEVILKGNGTAGKNVQIWFPDTLVRPDLNNFHLPVYAKLDTIADTIKDLSFKAEVSFDASLFLPHRITNGKLTLDSVYQRQRFVQFTVDSAKIDTTNSIITEIIGATMLGEVSKTSLTWTSFDWLKQGETGTTKLKPGSLEIIICHSGGDRLLAWRYPMELSVFPNPADNELDVHIKILETGKHSIELINTAGERNLLKEWQVDSYTNEEFIFNFETKNISSGMYYIVFHSPYRAKAIPVFIVK